MKAGEGYYGFADETASALEATVTHENGSESAPDLSSNGTISRQNISLCSTDSCCRYE